MHGEKYIEQFPSQGSAIPKESNNTESKGNELKPEAPEKEETHEFRDHDVEQARSFILDRITKLGEIQDEEMLNKKDHERVLNARALSLLSEARQWLEEFPERSWDDFSWEKRSNKWRAYEESRKREGMDERATLDAFRETDMVLEYIKTIIMTKKK